MTEEGGLTGLPRQMCGCSLNLMFFEARVSVVGECPRQHQRRNRSIYLSICLSIYLSIYPSLYIYMLIYLYIYIFINTTHLPSPPYCCRVPRQHLAGAPTRFRFEPFSAPKRPVSPSWGAELDRDGGGGG